MSLAKTCDVCGKLYEYYSGKNGLSINCVNARGVINCTARTYDCCPECMKALEKFIKERRLTNGRSL